MRLACVFACVIFHFCGRGWFAVDLVSVLPFFLISMQWEDPFRNDSNAATSRRSAASRSIVLVRLVKLLRMLKLSRLSKACTHARFELAAARACSRAHAHDSLTCGLEPRLCSARDRALPARHGAERRWLRERLLELPERRAARGGRAPARRTRPCARLCGPTRAHGSRPSRAEGRVWADRPSTGTLLW